MADYSYTSYGTAGANDGGGFVAGDDSSSQNPNAARRDYGDDSLRPVTIRQLNQAEQLKGEDKFKVDGVQINQLTFVGRICGQRVSHMYTTFTLDDGTGTIEVNKWPDPESLDRDGNMDVDGREGQAGKEALKDGIYARVFAKGLDNFQDKRKIIAKHIRPVTDYNEVQCHLLEATVVHLNLTRGPPGSGQKTANAGQAMQGIQMDGAYDGKGQGQSGGSKLPAGLSPAARKVYNCLNTTPQTLDGLHMQDIASRLGMDMSEVARAGDELVTSALVYTTVDDHTWAILGDDM